MIKIHNFPRGVRGLRVMWQCEEMGLEYQFVPVTFPPSKEYLALHALGSVPFLEDDGVAQSESVAMMLYLAEQYGPTPLLPGRGDPRLARVLELTVFSEASLGGALNTLMAAHFAAPEADRRNWSVTGLEQRVRRQIEFIELALGDQPYLVGADLTLADLAIATGLGMWTGALGHSLPDSLTAYRERLAARPAYQRARAAQRA